jgi:hypothetical protein
VAPDLDKLDKDELRMNAGGVTRERVANSL